MAGPAGREAQSRLHASGWPIDALQSMWEPLTLENAYSRIYQPKRRSVHKPAKFH